MEKKNIKEINVELINRENYLNKFQKAMEFLEEKRKDTEAHINFALYNFLVHPSLQTLEELGLEVQLKSLLNNEIAERIGDAYRTSELEWDDEHYERCYKLYSDCNEEVKELWEEVENEHQRTGEDIGNIIWRKIFNL